MNPNFFKNAEVRNSKKEKTTLGALVSDINTTNNKKHTKAALFISSSFTGKTSYICNIARVLINFKIKEVQCITPAFFCKKYKSVNILEKSLRFLRNSALNKALTLNNSSSLLSISLEHMCNPLHLLLFKSICNNSPLNLNKRGMNA